MRHGAIPILAALLVGTAASPKESLGVETSLPDSRLGIRTAPLLLLTRPDVRRDLGLDDRQTAEAGRAIAELHARAAAVRGKTGAEAVAARRAIDEEQQRRLNALLSEAQRVRLDQIDLQWEGPSALTSRPVIADSLGLDARQRESLAQAVAERNHRLGRDPDRREAERILAERTLTILSNEQKIRWKAMLGRPLVLSEAVSVTTATAPR